MKYATMISPLFVTAAAMMAFVGTASATTVTAPAGTVYTGKINASAAGHVVLHNPIAKIECDSTVEEEKVATHGVGVTAKGKIKTLTFAPCTNNWHVTAALNGELEVHGANGEVTSTGATVNATRLGINCNYVTNGTKIGTLTNAPNSTSFAEMHIVASIPIETATSSALCGTAPTVWTGAYTITTPQGLVVDA